MPSVVLTRHADAPWSPDESSGLSDAGRASAARLADRLAALPLEAIYSSPYPRARETVAPLARQRAVPIRDVADLRERRLGDGPFADFGAAVRRTWEDFSFAHPGGESSAVAQPRVVAAYVNVVERHPEGRVALSTHGNALALLLNFHDPSIGFGFWEALSRPDVFRLEIDRSGRARIDRLWREGA